MTNGEENSLVLVTGVSGAGKTTALKALEDNGFEVIDNLPVALIPSLVSQQGGGAVAVGIDTRTRDFDAGKIFDLFQNLRQTAHLNARIVFLDCDDDKLIRRFTETRRAHPLAKNKSIVEGIAQERRLLEKLRTHADVVIDTTQMRAAELSKYIEKQVLRLAGKKMVVTVCSFSFRDGLPVSSDLVFDVRFLRNPYYDLSLRDLTGRDAGVADYIRQDPDFAPFFNKLTDLLDLLLPRYAEEGKSYLTIAVGCTGGKHRSVFTAESLYAWLSDKKMYTVLLEHHALAKYEKVK